MNNLLNVMLNCLLGSDYWNNQHWPSLQIDNSVRPNVHVSAKRQYILVRFTT